MVSIEDNKSLNETIRNKIVLDTNPDRPNIGLILYHLAFPKETIISDDIFNFHSMIKINGQIDFNIVLMNYQCIYTVQKLKEKEKIKLDNIRIFGIKVYDIFRVYWLQKQMVQEKFENDNKKLYDKILKKSPNNEINPILGYVSLSDDSLQLIRIRNKLNHTVENFANHVVLFSESQNWFDLYVRERPYAIDYDTECLKILNKMISHIGKSLVQSIINVFYFNTPTLDEEIGQIIFDDPKSLLSIMEEYCPTRREFFILKKIIKKNNNRQNNYAVDSSEVTDKKMIFDSVDKFIGNNSEIVSIAHFDKIYFRTWDLTKRKNQFHEYFSDIDKICDVINIKYRQKRKQNSDCAGSNMSWTFRCQKKYDNWRDMIDQIKDFNNGDN
jgi:hypothetical protein